MADRTQQTPPDGTKPDTTTGEMSGIKPGMTEQEIRDAGLAVDVPFESGAAQPERLRYANLGADKKFAGGGGKQEPVPASDEDVTD